MTPEQRSAAPPDAIAIPPDAMQFPRDPERPRHPKGLYVLFGVEMWERFSFYGMRAILPLYLAAPLIVETTQRQGPGRGWTRGEASILMGWYGGMCYLLPLIGGLLADRFIGTSRSMLIGGLLIAMGHMVLGITGIGELAHNPTGLSTFIGGLALICIGTGYFKPCVTVMVGQLYPPRDVRRDSAFAIFYLGINVGAFLGQTICGWLAYQHGWHYGFGAAAVGMLAGLAMYVLLHPVYLKGVGQPARPRGEATGIAWLLLIAGLALSGLLAALYHGGSLAALGSALSGFYTSHHAVGLVLNWGLVVGILAAALWFVAAQQPADRGPTACILIFMLFNTIFWLGFEQAATSLNFFAERNTDLTVGGLLQGDWELKPPWLQNVNPFLIIVLSPVFAIFWGFLARRGHEISQPAKIAYGLILLGVGYLFITLGAKFAGTGVRVSIFWLVALYTWHTIGELFISPTGLSFVTKVAPARFVSLLMGIWYVSNFLAHFVGGQIAALVEDIEKGKIELPWYPYFRLGGQADYFLMFVIAAFAAGLLILAATPLLRRMLGGREKSAGAFAAPAE
jgi:POT family proton-dependent oligopeptide transporter